MGGETNGRPDAELVRGSAFSEGEGATDFEVLSRAFDQYLARVGRSAGTRTKYGQVVREFGLWVGERPVPSLSALEIDSCLADWERVFEQDRGRPLSRATVRNRVCALRAFYGYLERFGLLRDEEGDVVANPMRLILPPTRDRRGIDWLHPDEDAALVACDGTPAERTIVHLLRWTGLRVSEACALRTRDLEQAAGVQAIVVRQSKTPAGQRTIPIASELAPQLTRWIALLERRTDYSPELPLLVTRNGTAMCPQYVSRVLKRVAFRANVRPVACSCGAPTLTRHERTCPRTANGENMSSITPHVLRRTFASVLLNRGLRMEVVSRLLGHRSVAITQEAYADLLDETIVREFAEITATPRQRPHSVGVGLANGPGSQLPG